MRVGCMRTGEAGYEWVREVFDSALYQIINGGTAFPGTRRE